MHLFFIGLFEQLDILCVEFLCFSWALFSALGVSAKANFVAFSRRF